MFFWFYIELIGNWKILPNQELNQVWITFSCSSWRLAPWLSRCRWSSAGWSMTGAGGPAPPAATWAPASPCSCAAPSLCPQRVQMWDQTWPDILYTMLLSRLMSRSRGRCWLTPISSPRARLSLTWRPWRGRVTSPWSASPSPPGSRCPEDKTNFPDKLSGD